jgi:hypothetical protein
MCLQRTLVQNVGGNAIRARTALRVRLFSSISNVSLILYLFFCRQNMRMENTRGADPTFKTAIEVLFYSLPFISTLILTICFLLHTYRLFVSYCAWMTSFRRETQQEQGPPPEELAQG